jgi:hypothetical protein
MTADGPVGDEHRPVAPILHGPDDDRMIDAPSSEGMPTELVRLSDTNRAQYALWNANLARTDAEPALAGLVQLADMESSYASKAIHVGRKAALFGATSIFFTLAAVVLAAISGFTSLGDLVGQQKAAWIALSSAVAAAVSAFIQARASSTELRTEAESWQHLADDTNDDVVSIVSSLPMRLGTLKDETRLAIHRAREKEPSRRRM